MPKKADPEQVRAEKILREKKKLEKQGTTPKFPIDPAKAQPADA